MKIPVGKIAGWIGRALLGSLISEAADRLSRRKPVDDRARSGHDHEQRQADRLERE
jgi:hypothetical protein